jgi:SOS response regulatory protein OraA/RecX
VAHVAEDDGLDDVASASEAAARKWRTLQKLDRAVAVRRLYGFLARKGFGGNAVRAAVNSVVNA